MYLEITARFSGHCRKCHTALNAGNRVFYQPGTKGVFCRACVAPANVRTGAPTAAPPKLKVKKVKLSNVVMGDPDDVEDDVEIDEYGIPVPPVYVQLLWPSSDGVKNYTLGISGGVAKTCTCTGHKIRKKCSHVDEYNRGKRRPINGPKASTPPPGARSATVHCPQCARINPSNFPTCGYCGSRLHSSSPPPSPQPPPQPSSGTTPPKHRATATQTANERLKNMVSNLKAGSVSLDDLADMEAYALRQKIVDAKAKAVAAAQAAAQAQAQAQSSPRVPLCYYCRQNTVKTTGYCTNCSRGPNPPARGNTFDSWTCAYCRHTTDLVNTQCGNCFAFRGNTPSDQTLRQGNPPRPAGSPGPEPPPPEKKLPPSWFKAMEAFQEVVVEMAMKPNAPASLKTAFEKYANLSRLALSPGTDKEGLVALRFAMIEVIKICFDHM